MPAPSSNISLVTEHCRDTGETSFWLSDPEQLKDGDANWGFAVYSGKDVWLATFVYGSQAPAVHARQLLPEALKGAVFIATAEV